jgi:hypothetical protein
MAHAYILGSLNSPSPPYLRPTSTLTRPGPPQLHPSGSASLLLLARERVYLDTSPIR